MKSLSAAALALLGAGCTHTAQGFRGVSLEEVTLKYGAPPARWLSTEVKPESILTLYAEDPRANGGRIVPSTFTDTTLQTKEWLQIPWLKSVRVVITPRIPSELTHVFGPKDGDPAGVYEFFARPWGDAACKPYKAALELRQALPGYEATVEAHQPPEERCIAYRFAGPLQLEAEKYVYVTFRDVEFDARGYNVEVTELRRANEVLARNVRCYLNDRARQVEGCAGNTNLLSLFM